MMRWLWLLVLAGCYRPNGYTDCAIACTNRCPGELKCEGGFCTSGTLCADGRWPDPPPGCAIPTAWRGGLTFGVQAFADRGSYTTDIAAQFAVLDVSRGGGSEHDVKSGPNGFALTTVVLADVPPLFHRTPRLSPEGNEIYLQDHVNGSTVATFVLYARETTGSVFDNKGAVLVYRDDFLVPTTQDDDPGTPTVLSNVFPRLMMIRKGDDFWELVQSSDMRWDFVRATTAAELGLVKIRDPQLSFDGLRLVFGGTAIVGSNQLVVYGATRTSLSVPFAAPTLILDVPTGFPFLAADCQTLYGRGTGSGQIGQRSAL